ncbi:MAG: putative portal protein [Prokaryotic dsDNA virus sp.]|nr:MAG: putative portal protein [Prokaryotic dsDNA virus sp.]|tara:strand:- start:873 stop:3041 length:2169 start_codon:yes stop_codon:yes gene_type:complete
MKKKQDNISVIHLAEYNLPNISENNNKDWIEFGDDNLYPQYLLELYNGSSINNAVIKGVSAMIYGEGLDATDREESDVKKESWLALNSLLHNSKKDTLKCLTFDLKLFGMCYVNTIWNKPRTKIVEIRHIPAQYIRSGKADAYGEVKEYYYSADWENTRKHKPKYLKAFDLKDRTNANQVLCIKDYSPGSYYYATPDYQGSTSYIQLDMEIAQFHLSNIKSGMFPSMAINMANGIPTIEERRTIERQINAKFAGSGNAGRILLTFNDGKDSAPEIVPINANDNSDSYQFLSQETTKKVLTGHRVTSPLLFGVKGDGSGFGNNADELRDSYSLFNNTVIKPFQNTLLEGLEPIFHANDINLDLYFKTLKPADFIDISNVGKLDKDEQEKEGIDTTLSIDLKDLQDIDTKPTKGMIEEAKKGLEWRREYGRGGTEVGVARARNISNGDNLSLDTIKRMNSFFARHEKSSKQSQGFKPGQKGFPSAGRIAWALWGGDAGQSWSAKKVQEIENVEQLTELSDESYESIIENLECQQINSEEWEIVEERDYGSEESYEDWADRLIQKKENFAVNEIKSNEDKFSYLDKSTYRVRFKYAVGSTKAKKKGNKSRPFCDNMMRLSTGGFVWRIEDIDKASEAGVNRQLGHKGKKYDLFKYKGGVYCRHKWKEILYRLKKGTELKDGQSLDNDYNKVDTIPKSYQRKPKGIKESKIAPINMPGRGAYPGKK